MSSSDKSEHTGIVVVGVVSFLFIFGLIGYFLGIDTNLELEHESRAQQERSHAAESIMSNCLGSHIFEKKCIEDEIEAYRSAYDGSEDLRAQKEMANWAKWLLILTAFTSWVSLLAVVYVARTFGATNDTLDEARNANQIMRDEQRPWLHVEIDEITEYEVQYHDMDRKDSATGIYFEVPFKIRNTGTSPAHNVSVSVAAHSIQDAYKDVEHFKSGEAPIFINQRGSLAPNTTISDEAGVTRKLTVAHEGPTDGFFCFLVAIVSYSTSQKSELPDARTVQNFRLISDIDGRRTATVSFKETKAQIGTFVISSMGGGTMT